MRSVFSRVLIAFVLFTVTGCALPDRTFNRWAGRVPPKIVAKSNPFVGTESVRDSLNASQLQSGVDPSDPIPTETNSQIAGSDASSATDERGLSQLAAGHSSIDSITADSIDRPRTQSPAGIGRMRVDKKMAGQVNVADRKEDTLPTNPIHSTGSAGAQVNNRSTADEAAGPIRLQGLEFDEVPASGQGTGSKQGSNSPSDATLRPWSDRLSDRKLESPRGAAAAKPQGESTRQPASTGSAEPALASKATGQLSPLPWQSDLEQLIARAERDLAPSKPDNQPERQNEFLRKQAQLRLLYLMAQRQEDALTAIPGIDPAQQEYWQQMMWALSNSFDTAQFPELTERAAQTVTPLSAALRLTREEAALSIKNMTFCRKISSFGNYERFPRNEFTPGYEVLLYAEIENFVSTPTVDGEYRTSLKSLIEIMDLTGKVVWTKGFPPTEDFCRNPRRDYFHNYQFHIPEDLATGTYTLKLTIADEMSHKRVSNSLNFVLK